MAITPDEARKQALLRLPMELFEQAMDSLIVEHYQNGESIVTRDEFLAMLPDTTVENFENWWWGKIAQHYRFAGWSVEEKPTGFHFKTSPRTSYFPDDK